MCGHSKDSHHDGGPVMPDRRALLMTAGGLAAVPFLTGNAIAASDVPVGPGPYTAKAYGVDRPGAHFKPMQIRRRSLGPHDVYLEVLYCGICHSDIHHARDEWKGIIDTAFPLVPGHEFVGRVRAIGSKVTKFKVGDIGGVGCMINSCLACENCLADEEQFCVNGSTGTYNGKDPDFGGHTFGGYSDKVVVPEHFVIRIPPGVDLAAMAPLMCAGITTFSPIQHWRVGPGLKVGIIGIGGLGHIAVKMAAARQAEVTMFTTSPSKIADAKRLGAKEAVLWSDTAALKRLAGKFDLLISTVPQTYSVRPFIGVLKLDGTLVNVGALEPLKDVDAALLFGRKRLAGSVIGGIAETQQVVDFCVAHNIKPDIQMVGVKDIDRAYERVVNKDVRYRYVIDMTSLQSAA